MRTDRVARRLLAAALCALAFAGLSLATFAGRWTAGLDRDAEAFAAAHRTPWLDTAMEAATRLGSALVLVPVLLVAGTYLWWRRRDGWAAILLWAALGGAVILYDTLKLAFGRARPPVDQMVVHTGGYAYPSGHSTQAMAAWGMLAVVAVSGVPGRAARVLMLGLTGAVILLVGVSRIYLGAHWLTDVLAGFAVGAAWLALLTATYARAGGPGR